MRLGTPRLAASFLPRTAVLELTYACNHRCLFCSCPWFAADGGYDERPELSVGQWKSLIARLCSMGVSDFALTGGEPLLKPGVEEIISFAAGCTVGHLITRDGELSVEPGPPDLHLLSNGRAMSAAVLDLCARHGVQLGLSLPGLETFAGHTGGEPDYVLSWIRRAAALGVSTHAGITVTRRNLPELYETIAEALLAGADMILLNRFMPGGRGLSHAGELMLDAAQLREMLDTAETVLRLSGRHGHVGTELPRCLLGRYEHLTVGSRCSAANAFFVIDPSGWVRVCNHSPVRLEHVDELDKVKDHPYWRRFALRRHATENCIGCPQVGGCDGGCREAAHLWRGSTDSADPLFAGSRAQGGATWAQ